MIDPNQGLTVGASFGGMFGMDLAYAVYTEARGFWQDHQEWEG